MKKFITAAAAVLATSAVFATSADAAGGRGGGGTPDGVNKGGGGSNSQRVGEQRTGQDQNKKQCGVRKLTVDKVNQTFTAIAFAPGSSNRSYKERQTIIGGTFTSGEGVVPIGGKGQTPQTISANFNDKILENIEGMHKPIDLIQCGIAVTKDEFAKNGYTAEYRVIQEGWDGRMKLRHR